MHIVSRVALPIGLKKILCVFELFLEPTFLKNEYGGMRESFIDETEGPVISK